MIDCRLMLVVGPFFLCQGQGVWWARVGVTRARGCVCDSGLIMNEKERLVVNRERLSV